MSHPPLPTFLILGAMKSGTTSLHDYLSQHPDVFFSEPKEPMFFEAEYERGLDWYRQRYFRGWSGQTAVGEARTHNLFVPFVPARIRESLPGARLVAILRNPVDRAWSHWWHRTSLGLESLPLREALEANRARLERGEDFEGPDGPERWRAGRLTDHDAKIVHRLYLELGHYATQLERYLALFPPEQLEVVLFEDLAADPEGVTRRLWRFVGVDPEHRLESPEARNVAAERVLSPAASRALRMERTRALARRVLPRGVQGRLRAWLAGRPARRPPMDPDTEGWLIEHYAPHVRALEVLLDRRLGDWLERDPRRTARVSSPAPGRASRAGPA